MQISINMDASIMWMTEKWGYQKSIFFKVRLKDRALILLG